MTIRLIAAAAAIALMVVWGTLAGPAAAQHQTNPVYTDDSPVASETLARVREFVASGNENEAVRELQRLLDDEPDRVLPQPGRPEVYISIRQRVHNLLLEEPRLLERYRHTESDRAAQELASNKFVSVERSRLLTPAGFEAALRIAQVHLENARFEAARLTLEQLERHPDRRPNSQQSRDAAELLLEIARYLNRSALWARLDDWLRHAGMERATAEQRRPVRAPPPMQSRVVDFLRPAPETPHDHVPTTPLWSTTLEPQSMPLEVLERLSSNELSFEDSENLWVLPTIVGDTVYINDGTFISARDRFTLQPRWAVTPTAATAGAEEGRSDDPWAARREAIRVGAGRLVEDSSTVTVHGRLLVATMGFASQGQRDGDATTHAVDALTGQVLWSVLLRTLDPQLDGASVRGPAVIEGDTVVLAARKLAPGRRITSLYLIGLSARDGSLQWLRPIASAGAIPWSHSGGRGSLVSLLHEGVVYLADPLGVIAAVEAATGRPVWIRRAQVPTPTLTGMPEQERAWQWRMPIPYEDSIIVLSPDRRQILRIDGGTGEVLVQRAAAVLGNPVYLLKAGSRLAAVSNNQIQLVSLNDLELGTPRATNRFGVQIQGRVVVAGDKLLVPRSDGLVIFDSAAPREELGKLRLDRLGNALPVGDQLLVVDADTIHSYLSWEIADKLLNERIAADPDDPHPAITYAELAFRANRHDRIAGAADRALAAIDRTAGSDGAVAARQRLFNVLRHMVESTQERWLAQSIERQPREEAQRPDGRAPEQEAMVRGPGRGQGAAQRRLRRPQEFPPLDLAVMVQVVDRLGRAARLPEERISHLMVLGRLREAQNQGAQAAEAYQRIIAEPALAAAVWRGQGVTARAELEASRRIRQLVRERGPSAYAAFEAQAALELDRLGPGASAAELERLARRYPAAGLSATVWARAAERHEAAGRTHASLAALREALGSAEHAHLAGVPLERKTLGEIAGALIVRLERLEQYFAAAQLISRLRSQYPQVIISDRGAAIDAEQLAADLLERLASLERLPRIGNEIRGETQPMPGWAIMLARSQSHSRACEHIMMVASGAQKVALWGIPAGAKDAQSVPGALSGHGDPWPGHLEMLWSRTYRGSPPVLLRLDPDSAYLFWDRNTGVQGPMIERISTVSGETRWRTDDLREIFPADAALQQRIAQSRNAIDTPIDGPVRLTDVLVSLDEQTLVVAERSGRIAVFDPAEGQLLWSMRTPITRVHDIDATTGTVVVGGAVDNAEDGSVTHAILVFEPRTGQQLHRLDDLSGQVRWLRMAEGAGGNRPSLIAGLQAEIVSIDMLDAATNWSIPGGAAMGSRDAWVLGERLFVLDDYRMLWMAPLATGQLRDQRLETNQHFGGQGPIRAWRLGPEGSLAAFTTERGVCIFDNSGRLHGIDSLAQSRRDSATILHPVLSQHFFVTVETSARAVRTATPAHYALHLLHSETAMLRSSRELQLEMPPRRIALLDGRILVTAGNNTFVYSAPELDR